MKVLVAMSGGVDSSVAAARAVEAGHEVVGVHLALSRHRASLREGSRGCCTVEDAMDARRVADRLGIPFYVWDFSERFAATVVEDFKAEYAAGRTPNPCLRCNEEIKFAALLDRALALGFDALATGHYADVVDGPEGLELHRAAAGPKDQSYVLGVLTPAQLAHAWFPLGAAASKAEVRAEAAARGFVTATKPDSYDICFIPDGDTRGWLADKIGLSGGDVVDREGNVLGAHDGALAFTVGQRKGLNLTVPASDGRPRFVLEVKAATNEVVVGPREALAITALAGSRYSALGDLTAATEVQVRAHAAPVPCRVSIRPHSLGGALSGAAGAHFDPQVPLRGMTEADEVVIELDVPIEGVAPGQSAVLYAGTRVLGQVTVDRTVAAVPAFA